MELLPWVGYIALLVVTGLWAHVWKPFFNTYASKKGEQLATKEDVERIRNELKRTTELTEDIKASIGYRRWIQERIRDERRADYVSVTRVLKELIQALQIVNRDEEDALLAREAWDKFIDLANDSWDAVHAARLSASEGFYEKASSVMSIVTIVIRLEKRSKLHPEIHELLMLERELWDIARLDLGYKQDVARADAKT